MTTREVTRVRELLAGTNPAPFDDRAFANDDVGRAALARILTAPPGPWPMSALARRPRLRRGLVVAVITAIVVVAAVAVPAVLPAHGSTSAYAATPPLLHYTASRTTARGLLLSLAAAAGRQPGLAAGRYDYVETKGWYLDTAQDTTGHGVSGQVDPDRREQWIDAAGSGRIAETRAGQRTDTSRRYGPGQLGGPPPLPATLPAVRAALASRTHSYGAREWLVAVQDIWGGQVVPPALQSDLLQALAGLPGLSVEGSVIDRTGRLGVAVSATSAQRPRETDTLIFDPRTGALLDYEEVAMDSGDFPVRAPATIGYTVWLRTGRVSTVTARP